MQIRKTGNSGGLTAASNLSPAAAFPKTMLARPSGLVETTDGRSARYDDHAL